MQNPELDILIQRSSQVDSRKRQQMSLRRQLVPSRPGVLRTAIGRTLIALGSRLAPESRPDRLRAPRGPLSIAGRAEI